MRRAHRSYRTIPPPHLDDHRRMLVTQHDDPTAGAEPTQSTPRRRAWVSLLRPCRRHRRAQGGRPIELRGVVRGGTSRCRRQPAGETWRHRAGALAIPKWQQKSRRTDECSVEMPWHCQSGKGKFHKCLMVAGTSTKEQCLGAGSKPRDQLGSVTQERKKRALPMEAQKNKNRE